MKSYRQKLEDHLACNGWEVVSIDSDHNEWWADEFWQLKSTWSPLNSKCFLTFLVDPQFEGNRRPKEGIWAIGASPTPPRDSAQAQRVGCIVLNKKFKANIDDFLLKLEEIRRIESST